MITDRLKAKALTVGKNPKWVEGYYGAYKLRWYNDCNWSTGVDHFINLPFEGMHGINPDTLCQCTGLKDKEGNLIYEGDILDHANFIPWLIKWFDSEWVLQAPDDPTIIESNVQDVVDMTLTGKNIHDINQ